MGQGIILEYEIGNIAGDMNRKRYTKAVIRVGRR